MHHESPQKSCLENPIKESFQPKEGSALACGGELAQNNVAQKPLKPKIQKGKENRARYNFLIGPDNKKTNPNPLGDPYVLPKNYKSELQHDVYGPYKIVKYRGYIPNFIADKVRKMYVNEKHQNDFFKVISFVSFCYKKSYQNYDKEYQFHTTKLKKIAHYYNYIMEDLMNFGAFRDFYIKQKNGEKLKVARLSYFVPKFVAGEYKRGDCYRYRFSAKWKKAFQDGDTFEFCYLAKVRPKKKHDNESDLIRDIDLQIGEEFELPDDDAARHVQKSLETFYLPEEIETKDLNSNQRANVTLLQNRPTRKSKRIAKRSKKVGKLTTPVTNLPGRIRTKNATFGTGKEAKKVCECDISASHFRLMMSPQYKDKYFKSHKEFEMYSKLFLGDFYTNMKQLIINLDKVGAEYAKTLGRSEFKIMLQKALTYRNPYNNRFLKKSLKMIFPIWYSTLVELSKSVGSIQTVLQKDEAEIMDGFILRCAELDIEVLTIYDSVIIPQEHYYLAEDYFGKNAIKVKSGKKPDKRKFYPKLPDDAVVDVVEQTIGRDIDSAQKRFANHGYLNKQDKLADIAFYNIAVSKKHDGHHMGYFDRLADEDYYQSIGDVDSHTINLTMPTGNYSFGIQENKNGGKFSENLRFLPKMS